MRDVGILKSEWANLQQRAREHAPAILWVDYQVSPAFPMAWFPVADTQFCRYVYAYGNYSEIPKHIVDGHLISAPWARICQKLGQVLPSVQMFQTKLVSIGIQGIQPLTQAEIAIYDREKSVDELFGELAHAPRNEQVVQELRAYYYAWLRFNGVIAQHIRASHEAFFKWFELR